MYMSTDVTIDDITIPDISFLQLSDSFFPTGLYTMSNGIESLFYQKKIRPTDIQELIRTYLLQQIGPTDCTALGNVYEFIAKADMNGILRTDRVLFSMRLIEEVRDASVRSGIQLLRCVKSFINSDENLNQFQQMVKSGDASGIYPVSFAVACNSLSIPKKRAGLMLLYGFTVSMVGAALRMGIIQHYEGQEIIHNLKPSILLSIKSNIDRPITGMWQFAPALDIIQIDHENMSSKMFIT
jgi:urease accessory protein